MLHRPWLTTLSPTLPRFPKAPHLTHHRLPHTTHPSPHTRPPCCRRDAEGTPKGDGSVCFVQEASVELALQLLDGVDLRPG